jgi:uncharacterized protein (DUF302 family)
MLVGIGMTCYRAAAPFDEALNRIRKALSRSGFEILRECDVASRIRRRRHGESAHCRILYAAEPQLLETAISTHASAALWLPIPIVLTERDELVTILRPAEEIVRDRAALLGLRTEVERSYHNLTQALAETGILLAESNDQPK